MTAGRRAGRRVLALALCVALAGMAPFVGAQSAYGLSISPSIDAPERTVTLDGQEYQVSAIAQRTPGDELAVAVSAPEGTEYDVDLYDADRQVVDYESGVGDDRVAFDTAELEPGSYVVGLYVDGVYEAIHPVVVAGYSVSTDHPSEVTAGSAFEVSVEVAPGERSTPPAGVTVVLWNDGTTERVSASQASDTEYVATVPGDALSAGEYRVYAAAQGEEEVNGEPELLAASAGGTVTVETASAPEPTPTAAPTATPSPTENGETSPTATETPTATEDASVVTPNPATESPTSTPGQPLSVAPAVAALALVALWLWRAR